MSNYREYDDKPNFKKNIGRKFQIFKNAKWETCIAFYDIPTGYYGLSEGNKRHFTVDGDGIAEIPAEIDSFFWIEPPLTTATASEVSHPHYYGGEDNVYEAIKVINALDLNFCLGSVVKYVIRAGKKDYETRIKDLQKAIRYLQFEIEKG